MKRKKTDEHEEFRNGKGIDVYYNELTGYFTIVYPVSSRTGIFHR